MRALVTSQALGITAQVTMAVPLVASSVIVARFDSVESVTEFAIAAGIAGMAFVLNSFGLKAILGIWGHTRNSGESFHLVRLLGVIVASLMCVIVLPLLGVSSLVIVLVAMLKCSDGIIEVWGSTLLATGSVDDAFVRIVSLSTLRLAIFGVATTYSIAAGLNAYESLVIGSSAALIAIGVPWLWSHRTMFTAASLEQAAQLMRLGMAMSISGAACALLVAMPRLMVEAIHPQLVGGYVAIALIVGTLAGMAFNTLWVRASVTYRQGGERAAIRLLAREGVIMYVLFVVGTFIIAFPVSYLYGIDDSRFMNTFITTTCALGGLFFAMAWANLLKARERAGLEAIAYTISAVVLGLSALTLQSIQIGILLGALTLVGSVFIFLRPRNPWSAP